jgi:uncharacterized protein (TIGR02646 family)
VEFIQRSDEPKCLKDNKSAWSKPWIDFYKKNRNNDGSLVKSKKPSDSHWTKDEVRNILITDFKNNCGYCGCSRPTPRRNGDNNTTPRGHVDHYRAKAIYPELTYEWHNYIWSCESCNVEKGEFDDPADPILNPCELEDCNKLRFIIDNGKYILDSKADLYLTRFINTDRSTMINSDEITVRRANRVKILKSLFDSIYILIDYISDEKLRVIINNNVISIIDALKDPEFHFLVKREYQDLRIKKPEVAIMIDNYLNGR